MIGFGSYKGRGLWLAPVLFPERGVAKSRKNYDWILPNDNGKGVAIRSAMENGRG